jgi:hypothetical protein
MGAWGPGIKQDDTVCDVIGAFEQHLKQKHSIADATSAVRHQFRESIRDPDDGPLFWIGLADAQWTYGELEPAVLQHVKDDLASDRSLSRWQDNAKDLARRRSVLEKFIDKIEKPNPRPKRPPKLAARAPKFQAGDCLSILLTNQQYGAGLVLATDHSNPEYGVDLVGSLNYMSPAKPTLDVFQKREWLYLSHGNWNKQLDLAWYMHIGFRNMKPRLEVVGRVDIRRSDPKPSKAYSRWENLGEQIILQREFDSGRK